MKVSVAMAAYNGERYLGEQLRSILPQLREEDELVIVDDGSKDATCNIIEGLRDPRIRLIRNQTNLGVLVSFEKALRHTTGDIIFLSDQDDVWHPEKVSRFLRLFQDHPETTLAISDVRVIDGEGRIKAPSQSATKKFHASVLGNVITNRYLGCAMAFRSSALRYCLPFPSSTPMHDMWIGILNRIYGKVAFLKEPLVDYRRHGDNASPDKHSSYSQMLRWRVDLVSNLLRRRLAVDRHIEDLS